MEAESTLVGAKSGVKLHAKSSVNLNVSLIINPWDAEDDLAFGFNEALDEPLFRVVLIVAKDIFKAAENLLCSLVKFWFTRVPLEYLLVALIDGGVDVHGLPFWVEVKHVPASLMDITTVRTGL